jgi:uncharacterized protein (TIGR03437 family)
LPVPVIMRIVSTLILQAALANAILAQPAPQVNSVVSAASYWNPIMKNSLLAAGSLVVIFGTNLGPATLTQVSAFPIPTTLAGTSVAIIGAPPGATQAYMIYTSANQVAVILPSNLALQATRGVADYTIAVSYNGVRSNPYTIQTTISNFDIFTANETGYGQAVAQNYNSVSDQPQNSYTTPAKPNQVVTLWGTGIGPYSTPDNQLPQAANDAAIPLTLYVGGVPANVSYHGRSGCCAGVDQVVFTVPPGVSGCSVPVTAVVQVPIPGTTVITSYVSNTASIAVSADGGVCSDPLNTPTSNFQSAAANGTLRTASIQLTQTGSMITGSATFESSPYGPWANGIGVPPPGSCTVFTVTTGSTSTINGVIGLNAGPSLSIIGNGTTSQITPQSTGQYSGSLPSLAAGSYTVSNGAGGADVGPFSATLNVAPALNWSLAGFPSTITTGNPQVVNWSGGDPNGYVYIAGASMVTEQSLRILTTFICTANNRDGQFTIPGYITYSLGSNSSVPGTIGIVGTSANLPIVAQGIDSGALVYQTGPAGQNVNFSFGTAIKM